MSIMKQKNTKSYNNTIADRQIAVAVTNNQIQNPDPDPDARARCTDVCVILIFAIFDYIDVSEVR